MKPITYFLVSLTFAVALAVGPAAGARRPGLAEAAPTDFMARALSASEVRLTWTDNAAIEEAYEVEVRTGDGDFGLTRLLGPNSESTTVSGLAAATLYTFRVRATGGIGDSPYSEEASTTTFTADPEPCVAGATTLCLNGGRFAVKATWSDFAGQDGPAFDAGLVSADSGLMYFFSPDNWEMLVKVLDGCAINGRFWVFAAATTDVEYTLRVVDTVTGQEREYVNPLGNAAAALTDTDAFEACP